MEGSTYKQTARALQDRGFVKVSRRGGTWAAKLTGAGRYYLEYGEHCGRRGRTAGVGAGGRRAIRRYGAKPQLVAATPDSNADANGDLGCRRAGCRHPSNS